MTEFKTLKSRTVSVGINYEPRRVYEFVSNPENFPKWATAFCRSVRRSDGEWIIETPQGPMKIRFASKKEGGILDHYVSPAPAVEIYVPMRVVSNGAGSEVLLTVFQQLDMSDEQFAQDLRFVEQDLNSLKRILEQVRLEEGYVALSDEAKQLEREFDR